VERERKNLQVFESARLTLRLAAQEVLAPGRLNLAAVIFLQARAAVLGRPEPGPMNPLRAGLSLAVSRRPVEFFLPAARTAWVCRLAAAKIPVVTILCRAQSARRGRRRGAS